MKEELLLRNRSLVEVSPAIWRLEPQGKMRVGVNLVGSKELLTRISDDRSLEQAINVATLPGVLDPVLTMPDIHQGYGFPIGGVAAFHASTGVVSPGGVGYDINCGVRCLVTSLERGQLQEARQMKALVAALFENIPCGVGSRRNDLSLTDTEFEEVLIHGAASMIQKGFGLSDETNFLEDRGRMASADPNAVSERAKERGLSQIGTLGSGNHFVEIQYIDEIYDAAAAEVFGLEKDQVLITIHTGSRGLGYQICSDSLEVSIQAGKKYGIEFVDKELAAAPIESQEGQAYLKAMGCAANFAFANRQVISHWVREIFREHFPTCSVRVLYDVCHNIAKMEEFPKRGGNLRVCVHRKGATRAYPAGHPSVPAVYRKIGQPVIVPGDMGRYSFILVGQPESLERSWGSACHGAGRELSRAQAKKRGKGRALIRELEEQGIFVKSAGKATLLEEMPEAYKDVSEVVRATETAGLASKVARLRPMGVVKG